MSFGPKIDGLPPAVLPGSPGQGFTEVVLAGQEAFVDLGADGVQVDAYVPAEPGEASGVGGPGSDDGAQPSNIAEARLRLYQTLRYRRPFSPDEQMWTLVAAMLPQQLWMDGIGDPGLIEGRVRAAAGDIYGQLRAEKEREIWMMAQVSASVETLDAINARIQNERYRICTELWNTNAARIEADVVAAADQNLAAYVRSLPPMPPTNSPQEYHARMATARLSLREQYRNQTKVRLVADVEGRMPFMGNEQYAAYVQAEHQKEYRRLLGIKEEWIRSSVNAGLEKHVSKSLWAHHYNCYLLGGKPMPDHGPAAQLRTVELMRVLAAKYEDRAVESYIYNENGELSGVYPVYEDEGGLYHMPGDEKVYVHPASIGFVRPRGLEPPNETEISGRFYLAVNSGHAIVVFDLVHKALNILRERMGVVADMKMAVGPDQLDGRSDGIVVYFRRGEELPILAMLESIQNRYPQAFRNETPFTAALIIGKEGQPLSGISAGKHVKDANFASRIARALADADIEAVTHAGKLTREVFSSIQARHLRAQGIDTGQPYQVVQAQKSWAPNLNLEPSILFHP